MINIGTYHRLNKLFNEAHKIDIGENDKFVIFSDLHMGKGGFNDDFINNSYLFKSILQNYYLERNYKLIMNGDVEELYKFSLKKVEDKWTDVYNIFDEFNNKNDFYKIFGNHDYELNFKKNSTRHYKIYQAIKLELGSNSLFIYHGHQTAGMLEQHSIFAHYMVKYIFRYISNDPIPIENGKRYKTEETAYQFSNIKKIISILGHTHRPLFESLSKIESLKMLIEKLIKKYQKLPVKDKYQLELQIRKYKDELEHLYEKNKDYNLRSGLYNSQLLVPCLFNSGAVTGKRGITGIEIKNGKISLVYWFDRKKSNRYLNYKSVKAKRLSNTDYYKAILKRDNLDYIFSRINLLG